MLCPSCQNMIPDDSLFCENCGARVERSREEATVRVRPASEQPVAAAPVRPVAQNPYAAQTQIPVAPAVETVEESEYYIPGTPVQQKSSMSAGVVVALVALAMALVVLVALFVMKGFGFGGGSSDDEYKNSRRHGASSRKDDSSDADQDENKEGNTATEDAKEEAQEEKEPEYEITYEYTYEIVPSDMSWTEAKAACEAKGGYLATIGSQEEFDTISALANQYDLKYLWVGACLPDDTANWADIGWIDGTPWTYENWYPGEPSRQDSDGTYERYLCIWTVNDKPWTFNDQRNELVRDFPFTSGVVGYVCEYKKEVKVEVKQ